MVKVIAMASASKSLLWPASKSCKSCNFSLRRPSACRCLPSTVCWSPQTIKPPSSVVLTSRREMGIGMRPTWRRPASAPMRKKLSKVHSTASPHEASSTTARLLASGQGSWLMTVRPCRTSSCAASPSSTCPAGPLARVTSRTSAPAGPLSGLGRKLKSGCLPAPLTCIAPASSIDALMTSPAAPRTETLVALHMAMVKHRSFASSRSSAEESDVASVVATARCFTAASLSKSSEEDSNVAPMVATTRRFIASAR
mmetsp:Transcript_15504/g.39410  ORF Transcript_15504/g.39410 Transcript_15504/m.39410 type:complete len:255 (+) Transcript_15504:214-978(+)